MSELKYRTGSDGKQYRICYLCQRDETVGGAWVDRYNPCYFEERKLWIETKKGYPEGHALCILLDTVWTRRGVSFDSR